MAVHMVGQQATVEIGGQRIAAENIHITSRAERLDCVDHWHEFRISELAPMPTLEVEYSYVAPHVDPSQLLDCSFLTLGQEFRGLNDFGVILDAYEVEAMHDGNWLIKCRGRVSGQNTTQTPTERMRGIIANRSAPAFLGGRRGMPVPMDVREKRARETLRRVIGETKYRAFLRNGFISARATSGLVYQIFPANGMTKVFDAGRYVDRLCVVLSGNFPPTDSLIMRYLLIVNDERQFKKIAIKWQAVQQQPLPRERTLVLPLTDVYRELKACAV